MTVLLRRKLVKLSTALRPPSKEMLQRLVASSTAVQVRSVALNVAFVAITRTTQGLDSAGIAAAAHSVTLMLWQLGGVVLFAMGPAQSSARRTERPKPRAPSPAASSRGEL